jgi:hypothetical protein
MSATPAVAADRALPALTIGHCFRSLPRRVPHFIEIEPDGPRHLMTWDVSFSIRPIHRINAETELLSEFFDRHPDALHATAPFVVLATVQTLPSRAGEGNKASCGSLRQIRAVDAKAAVGERCNIDAGQEAAPGVIKTLSYST